MSWAEDEAGVPDFLWPPRFRDAAAAAAAVVDPDGLFLWACAALLDEAERALIRACDAMLDDAVLEEAKAVAAAPAPRADGPPLFLLGRDAVGPAEEPREVPSAPFGVPGPRED